MNVTSNRRAACDRCHRLKMRCISDSPGLHQQCNRCRGAGTPCHYSVPGKPGRPQSQTARSVAREATTMPPAKPLAAFTSPYLNSSGIDRTHFQYGALTSTEAFASLNLENADWSSLGLESNGPQQEELDRSSNNENVWGGDYSADRFITVTQLEDPGLAQERSGKLSGLSEAGYANFGDDARFLQHLSEFNTRLCHQSKLEPSVSANQIELAAAQLLDNSTLFLQLVNSADDSSYESQSNEASSSHDTSEAAASVNMHDDHSEDEEMETHSDGSRRRAVPPTTALLQLLVISMRITELHYCLYSAILAYLRRDGAETNISPNPYPTPISSRSLQIQSSSLSIAGFTLIPPPRLQLQLILQICAHYLSNIQVALHRVDGLGNPESGVKPNTQESISGSLLVRLVMVQEQQKWTHKISGVLAKIRKEHDIMVQFSG